MFDVDFYQLPDGEKPVETFLDSLAVIPEEMAPAPKADSSEGGNE